ncbi:MAG: glycosyltransferase family 2 protein [Ruminococcus sp.]|nr:glycosyltransferase family 2 protein [Ruminococcus sp.]
MKSNIKQTVYNPDPDKILLSIGMIVKNEEKHLENCLSALQKLRDNVSSELIIVDTGSTDSSKEIAYKYTDKVYDFEWINDFAAARNFGLKKAVGEWFMFIDADEYLDEDCDEIIKFFSLPELWQKYKSASIPILNYTYGKKKAFDQFYAPRLVRLEDGVEFEGAIHEGLPQPNPHGIFSVKLHHYGYVYANQQELHKKAERNLKPIFEEYKKNPEDLRVLAHLCDAMSGDEEYSKFEKNEKYFLEYYNLAKEQLHTAYGLAVYPKIIQFYIREQKYDKAIKFINEYLDDNLYPHVVTIVAIYWFASQLYMCESEYTDYDKAYEYFKKYFEYYDKYLNDELETAILRSCPHRGLTEGDYEEQFLKAAECANKLKKYDEALDLLDKVVLEDMTFDHLKMFLNVIRDLVDKTKDYSHIATTYQNILKLEDNDKTKLALFLMQQYYLEHLTERDEFMDAMIKSGVEGKYIDLMKLIKADSENKDISLEIQEFIDSIDDWNDGYAVAIYLAMKHNADLSVPIGKMSHKQIRDNLRVIYDGYYEYAKIALDYCDIDNFSDSIKKLYFMVTALEFAVEGSITLSYDDKGVLFDTFVCTLSDYVMNIYNPELLNPEDAEVLPELHRFGYYMTLAFAAQNNGNDIAYIRSLKEALRLCEPMKDVVSYYLKEFENTLK